MAITYLKRIDGSTNSLVQMDTSDTTAAAIAANYITAQAANIIAVNDGGWTWEADDMILLSASDGVSWAIINSTFTSLTLIASDVVPIPVSVTNGLTAHAGGGQASATALPSTINRVTTVATSGDSVVLPASFAGESITVINSGANPMQVFGLSADTINGQTSTVGVSQLANSTVVYFSAVAGLWQSSQVVSGVAGANFMTQSFANSLTAHAGGTQAAALALTANFNNVTTVATAADSVRLPTSVAGMQVTIANNGASSMQVYGAGTDTINSVATATGVPQAIGTVVTYFAAVAGNWVASLSSLGVSGRFTNLFYGATPVAQVDPASCTITAVAGAANVSTITVQLKDGSGTNISRSLPFRVYSSSAADGLTLQSAASTGYSVASGGLSLQNGAAITTQINAISSATGGCVLSLTDTGKLTSYLVLVLANGTKISAQLSAGSYG